MKVSWEQVKFGGRVRVVREGQFRNEDWLACLTFGIVTVFREGLLEKVDTPRV